MANTINFIISGDYEVFGNGSGDFNNCVYIPTKKILSICEQNNAKFTIFADLFEYWAFEQYAETLKQELGYYPHKLFESQIQNAIKNGHDVQLHLHPQWLGARYKNGIWELNYNYWRIPNMPNGLGNKGDKYSLMGVFCKGKTELENLLKPIDNEYTCYAFRAGGWCIQPAKNVILAMFENGIVIDSSVAPERYINKDPFLVDFRNSHSNCIPWKVDENDIRKKSNKNNTVLEVPIYTQSLTILDKLIFKLRNGDRNILIEKHNPKGCVGGSLIAKKSKSITNILYNRVKNVFKPYILSLDISNSFILNKMLFDKFLEKADFKADYTIVMEGHPKGFNNMKDFDMFLKYLISIPDLDVDFTTYKKLLV